MEPNRLIIAPQLPVRMRYQEWWLDTMLEHLSREFREVVVLGRSYLAGKEPSVNLTGWSDLGKATSLELAQIRDYMDMHVSHTDVLLHLDLSFPGFFHTALTLKNACKSVVFCHATSRNTLDLFNKVADSKGKLEHGAAALYDKVLVATHYHAKKLADWHNVRVMGALPYPPESLSPEQLAWVKAGKPTDATFLRRFGSVARWDPQKVNAGVQDELQRITNQRIGVKSHYTWRSYFEFLRQTKYLVITSREETFGYQVMDALLMGCTPIAPRAYSYPELLPMDLLYDNTISTEEQAQQIKDIADRRDGMEAPTLVCDQAAKDFWGNLVKELKT